MAYSNLPAAVLWDMDGTIVDTEEFWQNAQLDLLREHGLPPLTPDQELGMVGASMAEASAYFTALGVRLEPTQIVAHMNANVKARIAQELIWRPGARRLLDEVRAAGIPNALVTNSTRELAEAVVSTLDEPIFTVIVAGDEVSNGKPHPEPFLRGAELLGVDAADCVAIEDSQRGLEAARAAGCATVGIPHGQLLEAHHAHLVTSTLEGTTLADLGVLLQDTRDARRAGQADSTTEDSAVPHEEDTPA